MSVAVNIIFLFDRFLYPQPRWLGV